LLAFVAVPIALKQGAMGVCLGREAAVPAPRAGTSQVVTTHLGEVICQVLGPEKGPLAVAFHGMFNSPSVISEWDKIAVGLASSGYRVLLPNLHSNPKTAPPGFGPFGAAGIADVDFQQLALSLIGDSQPALLLGKSWGGGAVAKFAAKHGNLVERLVLVCPACKDEEIAKQLTMPVLLMWAEDDWITKFEDTKVYQQHTAQLQLVSVETGGHLILPEYTDPLLEFARKR